VPVPLRQLTVLEQFQADVGSEVPSASATAPIALVGETEFHVIGLDGFNADASLSLLTASLDEDSMVPNVTQETLIRTLFYEGLLTFSLGKSFLRVPNNSVQQFFVGRFSAHLSANTSCTSAAEGFILRGNTDELRSQLLRLTRPGLLGQSISSWYEFHASQRLRLLLECASSTTRFRWSLEHATPHVRVGGRITSGRADIVGRGPRRCIYIEVKQVNVYFDLAVFSQRLASKVGADLHTELLRCANELVDMSDGDLLNLQIKESSVKRMTTVSGVRDEAVRQAQDYARGWRSTIEADETLSVYVAMSFGPLRWYFERVAFPVGS
jgi:hypothetical protein